MALLEDGDDEVSTDVVDAKVAEYEKFIEDSLKAALKLALDDYKRDASVLQQCRELRSNLDMLLQDDVTELETMVELGCQFYARAFVPDTSRIFMDVGLGFHLEMPLVDAREFLEHKEEHILDGLEFRKQKISQIKADIH